MSPLDSLQRGIDLIFPVTTVFCTAEGGSAFVAHSRQDVQRTHGELLQLMKAVLRQASGACVDICAYGLSGYLCIWFEWGASEVTGQSNKCYCIIACLEVRLD